MKGFLPLVIIVLLLGCNGPQKKTGHANSQEKTGVEFATKFEIHESELKVNEPWPGAVQSRIYEPAPDHTRIIVTSTTHLPYLEMLGLEDYLVGFPGTKYISSPSFRKRVENGQITDLGPDGGMNLELLISLDPDAVFAFDMGSESVGLDKIEEAGIPVIYNADFLESSALGRAEWIRFFGAYFGLQTKADSVFKKISDRYKSLKELASDTENRPTILSGVVYGDIWYLPGGKNWAAEFYEDAGGNYLWAQNSTSGWIELSFESVYEKAGEADFWIGTSTFNTKAELKGQDARYADFDPFNNDQVYNYNKRISPTGGYDFFESGYARPDIVLADLIKIIHPELMEDYETYYFKKLP
ncbi:MAG: ABC transporter substrate-binding protein [Marinoscillum sp.]